MEEKTRQEILEKMEEIKQIVENTLDSEKELGDIGYYEELPLDRLGIFNAYEVQIIDKKKEIGEREEFVIYTKDNVCAAKVDSKGGVELTPEYKEQLKKTNIDYYQNLNLDEKQLTVNLHDEEHKQKKTMSYKEEKEKPKEAEAKGKLPEEDNATQEIANKEGIPAGNVLIVRSDSNFYKDHPEAEKNLYFCRGEDGIVRAKYIDENGYAQSSKLIKPSTTSLRQQSVEKGSNGDSVEKKIPYQTMETSLKCNDSNIMAVRINIDINNGYLEISESRQGRQNGEWTAHNIEVRGRDYNSKELNDATSTRTGEADPDRDTEAFNIVARTRLANDGIQYDEMQSYAETLIEKFVDDGYNREEAIKICNYMIGEEKLEEDAAKAKVNEEIRQNNRKKDTVYGENDEGGRTPGGDAMDRRLHRMNRM